MLTIRSRERGDTIIEVLLALAVFSLVAMLSMQIMQRGTNTVQRAVEITHVREQVDSQAEALRAAHAQYSRLKSSSSNASTLSGTPWAQITGPATLLAGTGYADTSACPDVNAGSVHQLPSNVFALDPTRLTLLASSYVRAGSDATQPPYAQVTGDTPYGIWIERTYTAGSNSRVPGLHTFRIRACWDDPSSSVPLTLETTVGLYEVE